MNACNPIYDSYCGDHHANDHCDRGCNTAECGWDGLDCDLDQHEVLADGTLVFVVLVRPDAFRKVAPHFLRRLGLLLHSIARVKHDGATGEEMIYPWPDIAVSRRKKRSLVLGMVGTGATRAKRASDSEMTG